MRHLPALLIGFVAGAAFTLVVVVVGARTPPPTPILKPATAITVTLHPWELVGEVDGRAVDIPPDKLDFAFRLLTPGHYFEGGVHEFITPIVAEAAITHSDGTTTRVLVRDGGHNPAVVSVDGQRYFYARNDPDVHAGAMQLIRLANEVRHQTKDGQPPKP